MLPDAGNPSSRRSFLALWVGFGAAVTSHAGCSRNEPSTQAKSMPPRLAVMREIGRAARPTKPRPSHRAGQSPFP